MSRELEREQSPCSKEPAETCVISLGRLFSSILFRVMLDITTRINDFGSLQGIVTQSNTSNLSEVFVRHTAVIIGENKDCGTLRRRVQLSLRH